MSDIRALPSGYVVHPFVALAGDIGELTLQPGEAAASFEATLADLLNERAVSTFAMRGEGGERRGGDGRGGDVRVPCYRFGGNIVWGLTAMILAELKTVLLPARSALPIRN